MSQFIVRPINAVQNHGIYYGPYESIFVAEEALTRLVTHRNKKKGSTNYARRELEIQPR